MCSTDMFLGLLAVLFPPLPVWVKCGICSADSIINILLCFLGFIPGLFHAWYIIAKFPEPPYDYEPLAGDREGAHVTYVYVQQPRRPACNGRGSGHGRPQQQQQQQQQQGGINYGTQGQGLHRDAAGPGEGGSNGEGVPPSYADVVAGDHKVQSRD